MLSHKEDQVKETYGCCQSQNDCRFFDKGNNILKGSEIREMSFKRFHFRKLVICDLRNLLYRLELLRLLARSDQQLV